LLVCEGIRVDRARIVQEFGPETRFGERVRVSGLERVYWGEPTLIPTRGGQVTVRREDVEQLVRYLQTRSGNIFVAGDFAMLYALLGKPSPQPLLYFAPGLSFTAFDIPRLDVAILRSLRRNDIQTVITEQFTFMSTQPAYSVFPQTWSWLTGEFTPTVRFGIFEVAERKR
jgi:hypothetical protein